MTRWVNFRENHLHENELQLSDYNISKNFDPNIYVSGIFFFTFFYFGLESFISKTCKYIFFSTRNWYKFERERERERERESERERDRERESRIS